MNPISPALAKILVIPSKFFLGTRSNQETTTFMIKVLKYFGKVSYLGRIKLLRGPGPSQGCGAPMGPQNHSIDQHDNLSVNLFFLKTISFAFPFSFSPSFPPFSFFSLFFSPIFYFLSFIQKHLLGAGPWARAQRAHRLIRHSSHEKLVMN